MGTREPRPLPTPSRATAPQATTASQRPGRGGLGHGGHRRSPLPIYTTVSVCLSVPFPHFCTCALGLSVPSLRPPYCAGLQSAHSDMCQLGTGHSASWAAWGRTPGTHGHGTAWASDSWAQWSCASWPSTVGALPSRSGASSTQQRSEGTLAAHRHCGPCRAGCAGPGPHRHVHLTQREGDLEPCLGDSMPSMPAKAQGMTCLA